MSLANAVYRVHHRLSRFRGRYVVLAVRPRRSGVGLVCCAVDIGTDWRLPIVGGECFVCPFRGLRRVKEIA